MEDHACRGSDEMTGLMLTEMKRLLTRQFVHAFGVNPDSLTARLLTYIKKRGVKGISMGVASGLGTLALL